MGHNILGIGIYNILSHMESSAFGINSIKFRKVIAISCICYFYGWIPITDCLFYLLFGLHDFIVYFKKYGTIISSNYCFILSASAEIQVDLRVNLIFVSEVGLYFEIDG